MCSLNAGLNSAISSVSCSVESIVLLPGVYKGLNDELSNFFPLSFTIFVWATSCLSVTSSCRGWMSEAVAG